MPEPRRMADPRSLKAIAHPLRNRLLHELYARGLARAADLAAALDVPANSVSFHLRELARYGLIEEATDASTDGRDRWWRPVSEEGARWDMEGFDEAGKEVAAVWARHAAVRWHHLVDRMTQALSEPPDPGVYLDQSNVPMFLTKEEAGRMTQELLELLGRWTRHGWERQAAGDSEGRRTYVTVVQTAPQEFLDG